MKQVQAIIERAQYGTYSVYMTQIWTSYYG
jgi:hypothetical protein